MKSRTVPAILLLLSFGFVLSCDTGTGPETGDAQIVLKQGSDIIALNGVVDFGDIRVASSSEEIVFSLQNNGDGAFQVPSEETFEVRGANSSLFVLYDDNVPAQIGPGETAYFSVTFTPDSIGEKTATIKVPDESASTEFTFEVIGRGTNAPAAVSGVSTGYTAGPIVTVSWSDNSENEDGFRVWRKAGADAYQNVHESSASVTSWDDVAVLLDTQYTYKVVAFNDEGNAADSNESVLITPPTAPTAVTSTATATNQVHLTWSDTSDTETEYRVERQLGAGSWSEVGTLAADTSEYYDTYLSTETAYTYRIRGYNGHYYSDYGTGSEVTTLPVWTVETVDSTGTVGQWTSIALFGDVPHISYYYVSGGDLRHASRSGGTWSTEPVDSSSAGKYSAIDIDSAGRPYISYWSEATSPSRIGFAEYDGSMWNTTTSIHTDSSADTGMYSDIVIDASNDVHLSYWSEYHLVGGTTATHAVQTSDVWQTAEQLDPNPWDNSVEGLWTSIGLDTSGRPHIVFYGTTEVYSGGWNYQHDLSYIYYDGSSWSAPEVVETYTSIGSDDGLGIGKYLSLVMDGNTPRISYYDDVNNNGDLRYAYRSGSWTTSGVDTNASDRGKWSSIAQDGSGDLHISYYDDTANTLLYAFSDGSWSFETPDTSGSNVGEYSAVAVDSTGLPHISYYDATAGDLKYARKNPTVP